jgi:peptidoglycan/xylan/chitin deacetylase (PgdA/CDA1 family)/SAM-dependent methyltransferase
MRNLLLTIDDSPTEQTPQLLDFLTQKNWHAIFFCIGEQLARYPDQADRIIRAGYPLGNHSFTHRGFSTLTLEECRSEIERTEAEIDQVYHRNGLPRTERYFRFPYGDKGGTNKAEVQALLGEFGFSGPRGLNIRYPWYVDHGLDADRDVFWTIDSMDYRLTSETGDFSFEDLWGRFNDPTPAQGGTLTAGTSDEIFLIHDHPHTEAKFPGYFPTILGKLEEYGVTVVSRSPGAKNSTTRFSDRVEHYRKYRPNYPQGVFDALGVDFGIGAGTVAADVGSGTGIFTHQLLPLVKSVFAVEPNPDMRRAAESWLAGDPGFHSQNGTSEATGLADHSVDCVFAAQAFHWFDLPPTKAEFRRILKPRGRVFLLWNKRRLDSDFLGQYEALVRSIPGYSELTHDNITRDILEGFLGPRLQVRTFPHSQEFDLEGLLGRFQSSSYTPREGTREFHEARAKLEEIFHRTARNGRVAFLYETELYSGDLNP